MPLAPPVSVIGAHLSKVSSVAFVTSDFIMGNLNRWKSKESIRGTKGKWEQVGNVEMTR